jgi:Putative addiction module component
MSKSGQWVLREALQLELADRAEVAAELLASLDGEPDADAEAAWAAEIERRAGRARSGDDTGQTWTAARDRARDTLSKH